MHPEQVAHLPEILAVFGANEDVNFDQVVSKAARQGHVAAVKQLPAAGASLDEGL